MSDARSWPDSSVAAPLAATGRSRGWLLAFGGITLVAGVVALVWPGPAIVVIAVVFGIQLLVGGIFWFFSALGAEAKGTATRMVLAVLAVVAGVLVLRSPADAALVLPLVLGLFWTVSGIIEAFHAIVDRQIDSRGLAAAAGVLSVVAGVALLALPGIGLVTMTYLLGVWLLIYGSITIGRAIQMRPHVIAVPGGAGTAPA